MGNYSLFILSILSYILGLVIIVSEFFYIVKNKQLKLISLVRLFFALIYGITAGSIYLQVFQQGYLGSNVAQIDFSDYGIKQLWMIYLFSVIAIMFLNLGYLKFKKEKFKQIRIKERLISSNCLEITALILTIVGAISLLLWTNVYGGPLGILPYANDLRAGRDIGIYNPFSFFMKLCQFSMLGSYIFFGIFLTERKKYVLFGFVISSIFSFLYVLANSSRMWFVLYFVILFIIYEGYNKKRKKKKKNYYLKYMVMLIGALILMSAAEPIMAILQNDDISKDIHMNINPLKLLSEEFFFPFVSSQTAINAHINGIENFRFITDILSGLLAWLPSRFRPEDIKQLEIVNTILINGTTIYGGMPTDIIAVSIYDFGFMGVAILPYIFGRMIRRMQSIFDKNNNLYYKILYILTGFYMVKAVAYTDFANIMSNIFYVVCGHILIVTVNYIIQRRGIGDKKRYVIHGEVG